MPQANHAFSRDCADGAARSPSYFDARASNLYYNVAGWAAPCARSVSSGGAPIGDAGNARQLVEKQPRPPVNVVLAYLAAHAVHAVTPLFGGHGDGTMNRGGHVLDVVGVHQQRIAKVVRGAGESAQDQDAVVIVARGDEFLGDEIHAVVERRDHAEVGEPVEGVDLAVIVMPLAIHDGLPAALAEIRVERTHHLPRLLLNRLIARDATAAGRGDLDEREAPAILGPALEEAP